MKPSTPKGVTARRAFTDVAAQTGGQILGLAASLVATLIVVRALGPDEFGRWATLLAVVQICGYLAESGLQLTTVREAARRPEDEGKLLGALVALRAFLSVPSALVATAVVLAVADTRQMVIAGVILALGLVLGTISALKAVFQLRVRNDIAVGAGLVSSLLWLVMAAVITAAGARLDYLACGYVATQLVQHGVLAVMAMRLLRTRLQMVPGEWPSVLRNAIPLGVASLLVVTYGRIDQVMVYQIAGLRDASLYGAVYRLLDQARLVPLAVVTTALPLISAALLEDPRRASRMLSACCRYLLFITLPVLALSLVMPRELVELLFGPPFADASPALPVLMGAFGLISFGLLAASLMVALGAQRRLAFVAFACLVLNVVANALLIPQAGFVAAAWTTLATELLFVILCGRSIAAAVNVGLATRQVTALIGAAMGMAGLVLALKGLHVRTIWTLAVSTPAYLAGVVALGGITRADLTALRRAQ